ncbi:MAG: hypothetical protein AABW67_03945 [Nanoarchaeota archaeon]
MKNATIEDIAFLLLTGVLIGMGVVVDKFKNIPDWVCVLLSILVLILFAAWMTILCEPDDEPDEPEKGETKIKI